MKVFKKLPFVLTLLLAILSVTSCANNIDYGLGNPKVEINIWTDSFIQVGSYEAVDIIWVIDRSCSMNDNDASLVAGVEVMMNSLSSDINWRLQMITTGDSLQPNAFPLTRGSTSKDALYMLAGLPIDHGEKGFEALQDYIEYNPYAQTWLRSNAALLVVFVSDEEEQSKITTQSFVSWYRYLRPNVSLSSIVNVDVSESVCMFPLDHNVGKKYIDATTELYGNIIDICSNDWSSGVEEATQKMEPIEELALTHIPSQETIVVFMDGLPEYGWVYDEPRNTVIFDDAPPEGSLVEISYAIQELVSPIEDTASLSVP